MEGKSAARGGMKCKEAGLSERRWRNAKSLQLTALGTTNGRTARRQEPLYTAKEGLEDRRREINNM